MDKEMVRQIDGLTNRQIDGQTQIDRQMDNRWRVDRQMDEQTKQERDTYQVAVPFMQKHFALSNPSLLYPGSH